MGGGDSDFFSSFGGNAQPVKAVSSRTGGLKVPVKKSGGLKVKKEKVEIKKLGGKEDPFAGLDGGWDDF